MAAAAGAKEMKVDIKVEVFSQCTKKDRDWALGLKGVSSKCKPIVFKGKAELDPRKWTEPKLNKEAESAGEMGLKLFSQRIVQFREKSEDGKMKEADVAKEVIGEYDDFSKKFVDALELWLEELASNKADNAKALKDGKAAMDKITSVDFKGAFGKPLKTCIDTLKACVKGGKVDPKATEKAKKTLEGVKTEMGKTAKEARGSIKFLLDTAKSTSKDKDADASLQGFGKKVLEHEDEFQTFLDAAKEFDDSLDLAIKEAGDEMDEDKIDELIDNFEALQPLEDAAQDCMKIAKKLAPEFKKIAAKLK